MRLLMSLLATLALAAGTLAAGSPPQAAKLPADYEERILALEAARLGEPQNLEVLDALAGSYTMAGDYENAIAVLRDMQAVRRNDPALQLRLARNQAWAKQTGLAIDNYQAYLVARPDDREAAMELIRLLRYRGDYGKAEKLCNHLLQSRPDDQAVLALKAEVLHWAGHRRFLARDTAERAVRAEAGYPDAQVARIYALRDLGENRKAREQFETLREQVIAAGGLTPEATYGDAYRLLEDELGRPVLVTTTPAYSVYNDADGIHNAFWGLRLAAPLRSDHALLFDLSHNRSSAPLASVFTAGRDHSSVSEFSAGGTFRVAPAAHLTLLGGGSRRQGESGLRPVFDFQFAAAPLDRWTVDFSAGREFLKVTPRAIDRDISSYKIGGGVQYAFNSRTTLAARADRRFWSDDNRSVVGEATFRRILRYYRPFMVDAGALSRWEKFDRDTRFESGFFTPELYRRHDAFLGLHGELRRRISYDLRGALGAQRVARGADYRPDWEATATAAVRITGSLRLSAGYQRRNYTLLSRNGWYQGFYLSLWVQQ